MDSLDNPYVVLDQQVGKLFYRELPKGFQIRMTIVMTLAALGIVLNAIYMVILRREGARKKVNPFWVFSLVLREEGRYIITNTRFCFAALNSIAYVFIITYFSVFQKVFFYDGDQRPYIILNYSAGLTSILCVWVWLFGVFQSYLLVDLGATGRAFLSPLVANSLFIGGGTVGGASIIISGAMAARMGYELAVSYYDLKVQLTAASGDWINGFHTPLAYENLMEGVQRLEHRLGWFNRTSNAAFACIFALVFILLLLVLKSVRLIMAINRHLQAHVVRFTSSIPDMNTLPPIPLHDPKSEMSVSTKEEETTSSYIKRFLDLHVGIESKKETATTKSRVSKKWVVQQLQDNPDNLDILQQGQSILRLKKTKRDFVWICSMTLSILVPCCAVTLFLAVNGIESLTFVYGAPYEISTMGIYYLFIVATVIITVFLIFNSWKNTPKEDLAPTDVVYMTPKYCSDASMRLTDFFKTVPASNPNV